MKSFMVKNLRSFGDEETTIELNNVTLLLGANSSGKSSLIRFLPLMKQSIERRTTGPILWYGRLVDFGEYKSAINRSTRKSITYGFSFLFEDAIRVTRGIKFKLSDENFKLSIKIFLTSASKNETARILRYEIGLYDHFVAIVFNARKGIDSLEINGQRVDNIERFRCMLDGIVPRVSKPFLSDFRDDIDSTGFHSLLKTYLPLQDADEKIFQVYDSVILGARHDMYLSAVEKAEEISITWYRTISSWGSHSKQFKDFIGLYILSRLPDITQVIYEILRKEMSNSTYIAPLRANAERYYRFQDLAIDEIDSKGQNTPMYLYNMTPTERKNFQSWCIENFGFYFTTSLSNGQITVDVGGMDDDTETYNIIDMGFGFSQILPIIAQIWAKISEARNSHRFNRSIGSIIIIEQPELHLHPKMQAKFAELIMKISKTEPSVKFLIETHSQTIMNKIGNMIYRSPTQSDSVSVYLFKKEDKESTVLKTRYDEEGVLERWPINFLESY